MKVYLLLEEYYDAERETHERPVGVYSTKELATKALELLKPSLKYLLEARIEEMELDSEVK